MMIPDTLRPLTAGRLLQIWREVSAAEKNEAVRGLLCNARVLQESCYLGENRLFDSVKAVLDALTVREMEALLRRLANPLEQAVKEMNPNFDKTRFQTMREGRA